jgi:hypothetical protein
MADILDANFVDGQFARIGAVLYISNFQVSDIS